ncbi:MAG: Prophage tail length tape measure protein [Devosia sp.]|jgi:hypothetical protein|nr:Prophage tail length tape measure protein [Devosia sp.]
MQLNVVKTLTVKAKQEGAEQVKQALKGIAEGQQQVEKTALGMAVATERLSARQLSVAGSYEKMTQRLDRFAWIEAQLAKDMAIANRAYEQGVISSAKLASSTEMLTAKYDQMRAAETAKRASLQASSQAMDEQAASAMRLAAANDNARGSTANVAAQFQDIGVTAAMGMSPMMIALQQGTQLSAVLSTMQNPVRGLATAFLSILNPVSLLTIGFVALAAVAIQWFAGAAGEAANAEDAMEAHRKVLDDILEGYEKARQAANDYLDAASVKPEGATMSELLTARDAATEKAIEAMRELQDEQARVAASFGELAYVGDAATLLAAQGLDQLGLSAQSTYGEIDQVVTRLTQMANNTGLSDQAREYARDLLPLVENLRAARDEVGSLDAALRALPRDIQIRIAVSQEFSNAMGQIGDLFMDPRSRFAVAREQLDNAASQATATAQSYGQLVGVGAEYERVLASIDAAEAKAAEGTKGVGKAATAAAASLKSMTDKEADGLFQRMALGGADAVQGKAK